jgi:hypothetical protein
VRESRQRLRPSGDVEIEVVALRNTAEEVRRRWVEYERGTLWARHEVRGTPQCRTFLRTTVVLRAGATVGRRIQDKLPWVLHARASAPRTRTSSFPAGRGLSAFATTAPSPLWAARMKLAIVSAPGPTSWPTRRGVGSLTKTAAGSPGRHMMYASVPAAGAVLPVASCTSTARAPAQGGRGTDSRSPGRKLLFAKEGSFMRMIGLRGTGSRLGSQIPTGASEFWNYEIIVV